MRRSKARELRRKPGSVKKFSRIQNSIWIENVFELVMQIARHFAGCIRPPAFFSEPDPMFARDDATTCQNYRKNFEERVIEFVLHVRIVIESISHIIDMNNYVVDCD